MADDQTDLLLRIQSDVGQAVANLATVVQQLQGLSQASQTSAAATANLSQTVGNADRVIGQLGSTVSQAKRETAAFQGTLIGFRDIMGALPGPLQTAVGAMAAVRFVQAELATAIKLVTDLTIGQATQFGNWAREIRNGALEVGLSIEKYQALRIEMADIGLNAGTAEFALRRVSTLIQEAASGTGRGAQLFQQLGVSVRDMNGQLLPTDAILVQLAQSLFRISDQSTQVAVANELFGRRGAALLPILREMAQRGGDWADALKRQQLLMGTDAVEAGARFDRAMKESGENLGAMVRQGRAALTEFLLPWVEGMAQIKPDQWRGIVEAINPLVGLLSNIATLWQQIRGFMGAANTPAAGAPIQPLSAHAIAQPLAGLPGAPSTSDFTAEQQKRIDESRKALDAEVAANAAANAQITQSKRVALDVQFGATMQEIANEQHAEEDAARRTAGVLGLSRQEQESINQKYDNLRTAEMLKHDAEVQKLTFDQGQALTKLSIEAAQTKAENDLNIEKEHAKQLLATHQITQSQELAMEGTIDQKILQTKIDAQQQMLDRLHLEPEERQKIADELAKLEEQQTLKVQEEATRRTQAREKETEEYQKLLDEVNSLTNKAFGTETQQKLADLAKAHDEMVRKIRDSGHLELLGQVDAAYRKLADDATGVTVKISDLFKTGFEDAFSGAILGTRKMSDVLTAFKESFVKQMSSAFTQALLKKLDFDTQFTINATQHWPAISAAGATGIAKPIAAIFDLLGGGDGRSPNVSVTADGRASFAGGSTPGLSNLFNFLDMGSASTASPLVAGPGSTALQYATDASAYGLATPGGVVLGPSTAANQGATTAAVGGGLLSGIGGLALLGLIPAISSGVASGGSGAGLYPASILGSLASLGGGTAALASLGGASGALSGILGGAGSAVPYLGAALLLAQLGYNLSGPGHVTFNAGTGTAVGVGSGALAGLAIGTVVPGIGNVIGAVVGAIIGGIIGSLGTSGKTEETLFGHSYDDFLAKTGVPHVLGLTGHILNRDPATLLAYSYPGFDRGGDNHPEVAKLFPGMANLSPTQQQAIIARAQQAAQSGQPLPPDIAALMAGDPNVSKLQGSATALGTTLYGTTTLGTQFGNAFINEMRLMGVTADDAQRELLTLARAAGVTLPKGLDDLNTAFLQGQIDTKTYKQDVADLTDLFNTDLPKGIDAAAIAAQFFGTDGVFQVDQYTKYIQALTASLNDLAKSSMDASFSALLQDPTQIADANRQRSIQIAQTQAHIDLLRDQIAAAQELGDTVTAAQLQMQMVSEQAALSQEQQAAKTLSPAQQFLATMQQGIKKSIVDSVVSSLTDAGTIQVMLAPLFGSIKSLTDWLASNPDASPGDITQHVQDALGPVIGAMSFDKVEAFLTAISNALGPIFSLPFFTAPQPMATGGIVMRPTLALIGEAGPEAVVPLSHMTPVSSGNSVVIHVDLTGAYVFDRNVAAELGRTIGNATMRELKHNRLIG